MTNAEIIEYQRRRRALRESAQTVAARLRAAALCPADPSALMREAADVVDFLQSLVAQMRKDANEEARESRRACGDAYSEGRHDGINEARGFL